MQNGRRELFSRCQKSARDYWFGKLTSEGLRVPANLQTMRDNIRKETKKLTEIEQNHLLEEIKL